MKTSISQTKSVPHSLDKKLFSRKTIVSAFVAWILWISIHSMPWSSSWFEWACLDTENEPLPLWFRSSKTACEDFRTINNLSYIQERLKRLTAFMWGPENEFKELGFEIHEFSVWDIGKFENKDTKDSTGLLQHLTNVDGKIHNMMVMLWEWIEYSIVDILKHKITQKENFHFLLSYVNSRDLWDLLDALKKENIAFKEAVKYVSFLKVPSIMARKIWFRDIVFPVQPTKEETIWFVVSPMISSYDSFMQDLSVAAMASMYAQKTFAISPVYLDGWNILHDEDTTFIWISTILSGYAIEKFKSWNYDGSLKIDQQFLSDAKRFYEIYFNKPVLVIGELTETIEVNSVSDLPTLLNMQPVYHIDIFMTPLGDKKIALAESSNPQIKKLREQLQSSWYVIYDIPFIGGWKRWGHSVSYNNVIIEKTSSGWYVYVPQYNYGSEKGELWMNRDEEAIRNWKATWFIPVPVRISLQNLSWTGSLHCRMREIDRVVK